MATSSTDSDKRPANHEASKKSMVHVRRQLLKACRRSDSMEFAKSIVALETHAPEEIKTLLSTKDNRGWTLLHEACRSKDPSFCSSLIKFGAEINALTVELSSPLIVAAYNGRIDIVEILVRAGARIDLKDHEGKTALDIAGERNKAGVLNVLVNRPPTMEEQRLGDHELDPFKRAKMDE
jgi:ankyrin repeat protein